MTINNMKYIMYGHLKTAHAKDGNEYPYFGSIYSNAFGTKMCGDDKIYKLTFEPAVDLEKDKEEEVEYWGWLDNKGELSMVWANYFLFNMCFPNGAEASEGYGEGKRVKLNLLKFTSKY